jgi:hypothetical protein
MPDFQTSDDIPLVLRGGDSREVAMFNRIAAINRVNYLVRLKLPEFDIRLKSDVYRKCLDLEMYKRYYSDKPKDTKIDEEFCQNMAKTCIEMDEEPILNQREFDKYSAVIGTDTGVAIPPEPKKGFIAKLVEKFK